MKLSDRKRTEYDILLISMIGKEIEVIESNNKNLIGVKGTLVYESANLFYIETKSGIKKILKSQVTIKTEFEGKPLKIDGRLLLSTVLSRIKKTK